MKRRYETPEMEVVTFEAEDIIVTSGDGSSGWTPATIEIME